MALLVLISTGLWLMTSDAARVFGPYGDYALFGFVIFVLVSWRRVGYALQRFFTTKRPSDRQLASAIRVGEELRSKMLAQPAARMSGLRRLLHGGLPQVLAGFLATMGVVSLVQWLLSR